MYCCPRRSSVAGKKARSTNVCRKYLNIIDPQGAGVCEHFAYGAHAGEDINHDAIGACVYNLPNPRR